MNENNNENDTSQEQQITDYKKAYDELFNEYTVFKERYNKILEELADQVLQLLVNLKVSRIKTK